MSTLKRVGTFLLTSNDIQTKGSTSKVHKDLVEMKIDAEANSLNNNAVQLCL